MLHWIKKIIFPIIVICLILFSLLIAFGFFLHYITSGGHYEKSTLDLTVEIKEPTLEITYNDTISIKDIDILIADSIAYYHVVNPKFPSNKTVQFLNTDIIDDGGHSIDHVKSIKDIHINASYVNPVYAKTKAQLFYNFMFSEGGHTDR